MRLTFRFAEKYRNFGQRTNKIFRDLTKTFAFKYFDSPESNLENMRDLITRNNVTYEYTEPGNTLTSYLGYGGYIIEFY